MLNGRQLRTFLLPITVDGLVPALILYLNPLALGWPLAVRARSSLGWIVTVAGLGLIAGGLWLLVATIRLIIVEGKGTLAPWDPTQRLVVRGVYRHVRNPMISSLVAILLGEAAVFASPALLAWCALAALINIIYIPLAEEPGLVKRFGADYEVYRRNVPRWFPRRTPWNEH